MKKGFSLVELLIGLIAVSALTAALVPVITQKAHNKVQVHQKKDVPSGISVYSNPGTYVFSVPQGVKKLYISAAGGGGGGAGTFKENKKLPFTTNSSWTVPKGVKEITLTITGAGGGGGAANAKANSSTYQGTYLSTTLYNNRCLSDEFMLIRGDSEENDLCITKRDLSPNDLNVSKPAFFELNGQTCTSGAGCCWKGTNAGCTTGGCNKTVCTDLASYLICNLYKKTSLENNSILYRRPKLDEFLKILKYEKDINGASGLDLCAADISYDTHTVCPTGIRDGYTSLPLCTQYYGCLGGGYQDACFPYAYWSDGGGRLDYFGSCTRYLANDSLLPAQTRCARALDRFNRYSGAGGASGAQLKRTIEVKMDDVFEFTIGQKGSGGKLDTNNGKGTQGGTTQVLHKRAGTVIGKYWVKGGFGGNAATTNAHGQAISNTTVNDTCYSNGNTTCTVTSYSGASGSAVSGGSGGRVANTGTAVAGGTSYIDTVRTVFKRYTTAELNKARGQNASQNGFGGSGGFTPNWVCVGSNCTQTAPINLFNGGNGAQGKVEISYDLIIPGGGGGSAASIGTNKNGINHEIEYDTVEYAQILVTVGKGGNGGSVGQNGSMGTATIIMEDEIVLNPGQGGKKANGGLGGELKIKGSKIKILNADGVAKPGNGIKGENGQLKNASGKYISQALDGGSGAQTFLGFFGGCGGSMDSDTNTERNCATIGSQDGKRAKDYYPVKNQYGGLGGGGGGSLNGLGGDGSNGFVKIRW